MIGRLFYALIRLRSLLGKEFLQLLRDKRMRFFIVVPPVIQLVVFGYAATFDVRHADVGVVDLAKTQLSRALLDDVNATGAFSLHPYADMRAAGDALDRSQVRAILSFAPDFERNGAVQIVADGSDSNSALMVVGQLSQTLRYSVARRSGLPAITIEQRAWFNANLNDRQYFVPGIMANVVLIATLILTAMTVVREHEMGTLERLMVTPLGRFEFVIGKIVPVACIGLFDVFLVTLIAVHWFDVPFRGSYLALFVGSVLYLLSTLGLGLLVSSYSSTQQQALLLAFFIVMPMVILSGFAFPIRNMPQWIQWLTYLDPLRFFLVVIRDLFLKGGGVMDHLQEYGMMALLGCGALGISVAKRRD